MIRSIFWVIGLLAITVVARANTTAVNSLTTKLAAYQTYQASFVQVARNNNSNAVSYNRGLVWLQRPSRFRWESYQPTHQILVADGKTLWIYDTGLQEVTKRQLGNHQQFSAAELLTGNITTIVTHFSVSYKQGWYVLIPKTPSATLQQLKLKFTKGKLSGLAFTNKFGQTNTFKFANIKVNQVLKSSLFKFKVPPGVDVINQDDH